MAVGGMVGEGVLWRWRCVWGWLVGCGRNGGWAGLTGLGGTGQSGVGLGQRLKTAWEWAAVLGQVEVYGWQRLDLR